MTDVGYSLIMSSLLQVTYLLHQKLREAKSSSHIVLLVRNDIFTRLPLSDAGKMRDDFGIDLDWRMLTGQPERSSLFKLVNSKAPSLLGHQTLDVVSTYFPKEVALGGRHGPGHRQSIWQYLLNMTRHTPRDLLQLLEHVRRFAAEDSKAFDNRGLLRQDAIREGVVRYATRHFVVAVQNELVGRELNDPELVTRAISTLRNLPSATFTAQQFNEECFGSSSQEDHERTKDLLGWLFFAGAIGNERQGRERYMVFYHRRDQSEVYLSGTLRIHNALAYAQSTPFS